MSKFTQNNYPSGGFDEITKNPEHFNVLVDFGKKGKYRLGSELLFHVARTLGIDPTNLTFKQIMEAMPAMLNFDCGTLATQGGVFEIYDKISIGRTLNPTSHDFPTYEFSADRVVLILNEECRKTANGNGDGLRGQLFGQVGSPGGSAPASAGRS